MALGSTQPLTNEYQEYFLGGKGGRCVGLTTLPPSCADCLEIWDMDPSGPVKACNGVALPFTMCNKMYRLLLIIWKIVKNTFHYIG
jgi:hypothetical protein